VEMRKVILRIQEDTGQKPFVVVDSLQKVHYGNGPALLEDDRLALVVEQLKDLTLELGVPILAVVGAVRPRARG